MTMHRTEVDGCEVWEEKARPLEGRLYRTPYLVLPRLAIEAMPVEWQARLEYLLTEADETGMLTPDYYVIRSDTSYTSVTMNDPDDPCSWPREFYIQVADEWANYRHGNILDLNPDFKVPA